MPTATRVLVVDDLDRARRALAHELADAGFDVLEAADGLQAWEQFRTHRPDAVVTDMVMPHCDGIELLAKIRSQSDVPVIVFTARGSIQRAAQAFKEGADDFVASDEVGVDALVATIERAVHGASSNTPNDALRDRIAGDSPAMQRLRERIAGLAPLRHPVLVRGEPGTGRDAVVDAMHAVGSSSHGTLVRVSASESDAKLTVPNCSAIYLDGVDRFGGRAQSFWLKYVEDCAARSFQGSPRILASTDELVGDLGDDHADLRLRNGMLRYVIELPALRHVPSDIGVIAERLVERLGERVGRRVRLSPAARDFLSAQAWPGNTQQLEQLLERSIAFTRGRQIRRDTVHDVLADLEESLDRIRRQHAHLERERLFRAIRETGGNVSRTAELLGKSRGAIYRLIEKHDIPLRSRNDSQ